MKANQHVTVRASAGAFKSELEFTADAQGRVDLGGPEPEVARQEKAAPFHILWSMKMDPDARKDLPKKGGAPDPMKVHGSFEQLYVSPDVERIPSWTVAMKGALPS